ncbi:MAG: hypothetical protein QG565_1057, partial [Campylobacterota bacterium]|nr:hypothetical protein [Campylobacterota bacterium]
MRILLFTALVLQNILFASFGGTITDKTTSTPIENAIISDSAISVNSDKSGKFSIDSNEKAIFIKAYGYRPYKLEQISSTAAIQLEPITVKALYLTFWGANINSKTMKNTLDIIEKTEINAIVVDIKNEYGSTSYRTSSDKANSYGAANNRTIKDIKSFISLMKSKN